MSFKPRQCPSKLETVNEFTEHMKSAVEEAKSAICKVQQDMYRYYNQRRTLAPVLPMAYQLKLPLLMRKLHPIFNIVGLLATPIDHILGWRLEPPLPSIIIDRVEGRRDTQQLLALAKIPILSQVERIWLRTQLLEVYLQCIST